MTIVTVMRLKILELGNYRARESSISNILCLIVASGYMHSNVPSLHAVAVERAGRTNMDSPHR